MSSADVDRVGVAGAGTMGSGIAQLACLAGYETVLHDPLPESLERGAEALRANLGRGAERGRWTAEAAEAAAARLGTAADLGELAGCDLVVEAAPERLELKRSLFGELERVCGPDAVLATNTSSLPVADIAAGADRPERICGMHFFNPPALMKLVEVVAAPDTSEAALAATTAVAERMGRTPIRCTDSPGFVVNRCNRPFALESLRILDEGIATHDQIDLVMREDGGYRMGPFELMDLIGIDVNLEVARSFHRQRPIARWEPHPIQERMVAGGRLGRKTGRGFYEYADGKVSDGSASPPVDDTRTQILERVVAQLVNEAAFAAAEGVTSPPNIDTAMRLGLNHPRGPFEWLERLGAARVVAVLDGLYDRTGSDRYEV
ncbi:MAG TPA: 3-hydroxyacyl-CoA dehydrogenase NAD-binding domain-containing protein, partial [Solirubrobacterales bacterium]|nr:3-hydroxyacyl-CoA dehydrogenase NAD-binding domain-containing protein [Solirubrobacterales bacterium]